MKQALIVHGSGGQPNQIWFPWLAKKLENDGYEVLLPQFPNTPESQTLDNWLKTLEAYHLSNDCIAIGHSLGAPFLLNVLEKREFKAVFLIAGFTGRLNNAFDEMIKTFSDKPFDWATIKKNSPHFHLLYSDNDPYVRPEKTITLAKKLDTKANLVSGAGHFNSEAGYYQFDFLYELIRASTS